MAASPDAVLHLAVLHTLAQAGFASTSRAASVTLSGVLSHYLSLVAASCTERASLAGRSKVAAIDVVNVLEDLGVGGVTELQEWTADLDKEVTFAGAKMDDLAGYLRDGLTITDGVEAHFVPVESDEEGDEEAREEDKAVGNDEMDVDVKAELEEEEEEPPLRVSYRPKSPDMSWLPPMPTDQMGALVTGAGAVAPIDTAPAPQSVAERYRRPVAYATSTLAESHAFADPPKPPSGALPEAPSSFASLIDTYSAVVSEPSVALRQTDGRRQAADLLRLTVGNPDVFMPRDTLAIPLPPPHVSPIVPSHSDVLPPKLLPVNPDQSGIVSSLLHQIRSPYLPPPLRERLTALRPPQAQANDSGPILYGAGIRGPDEAALAKARGKAVGDEPEVMFRATWDAGPRGADRSCRAGLPTGKKVVRSVEGEKYPREASRVKDMRLRIDPDARRASAGAAAATAEPSPGSAPATSPNVGLKLRLGGPGAGTKPRSGSTASQRRPSVDGPPSAGGANGTARWPSSMSPPKKARSTSRSISPSKRNLSPTREVKHEPMLVD